MLNTSIPANLILPFLRLLYNASSLYKPPRAQLITTTPSFIFANSSVEKNGFPINGNKMGTLTITLKSVLSVETDDFANSLKLFPNPSNGLISITNRTGVAIKNISIYNILGNKPEKLSQVGFSMGFHLGFIKDMPINKKRNVALGLGLGYSANTFNQNLQINGSDSNYIYTILEDASTYTKNRFAAHIVEMPFEFRWRSSNPVDYEFWRVYAGFKVGYVFANSSKYNGIADGTQIVRQIKDFNQFNYGLTLCVGYNTWNFYAYYALNPIFSNNVLVDNRRLEMNAIKIGLMFYIL